MTEGQPFPNSGENNYRDTDGGKLYTQKYLIELIKNHRQQLKRVFQKSNYVAKVVSNTALKKAKLYVNGILEAAQDKFNDEAKVLL